MAADQAGQRYWTDKDGQSHELYYFYTSSGIPFDDPDLNDNDLESFSIDEDANDFVLEGWTRTALDSVSSIGDGGMDTNMYDPRTHPYGGGLYIYAYQMLDSITFNAKNINLSNNKLISNNTIVSGGSFGELIMPDMQTPNMGYGGAIGIYVVNSLCNISFANAESISIKNNGVVVSGELSYIDACGGAIAVHGQMIPDMASGQLQQQGVLNSLEFVDNQKVIIQGNYGTNGKLYYLTAIWTESADLAFAAPKGGTIECYDSIDVDGVFWINTTKALYESQSDSSYTGSVTLSGEYAADDLKKLKGGKAATNEELKASRRVEAEAVYVANGSLNLKDTVVRAIKDVGFSSREMPYQFYADKKAQLKMENSEIYTNLYESLYEPIDPEHPELGGGSTGDDWPEQYGSVSIANVSLKGQNTITADYVYATGEWEFNVGSDNQTKSVLHIEFDNVSVLNLADHVFDTTGAKFKISAAGNLVVGKKYRLLDFDKSLGKWEGIESVTLSGLASGRISESTNNVVYYTISGNTLVLWFNYGGTPAQRPSTTLTWIGGDGTWSANQGEESWDGAVSDRNYIDGDSVIFDQAAEVTVDGVVLPGDVLVSNETGKVTIDSVNDGQITGNTSLTKTGAGELELNLANAYTGGTVIEDGTLTVGDDDALGLGEVQLNGGELALNDHAVSNDITVDAEQKGGATISDGESYDGQLTLKSGKLTLEGDAGDGSLNIAQGKDAQLESGEISGSLVGEGGVVKTGAGSVTLSGGENTYTGDTVVEEGELIIDDATLSSAVIVGADGELTVANGSELSGAVTVEGGSLSVDSSELSGEVVVTADGGEVEVADGGSLTGGLTMDGGSLNVAAGGSVAGEITLNEGAVATVADGFTLGAGDKLTLGGATVNADVTVEQDGELVVTVEEQTLSGDLTLSGGTLDMSNGGQLKADSISVTSQTDVLLNMKELRASGEQGLTVLSSDTGIDGAENLHFSDLENTRNQVSTADNAVTITLKSETLTWDSTTTNTEWKTLDDTTSGDWLSESGNTDNRFYDQDNVIFADAGDVEIVGVVKPGSITVQGGETTFTSASGGNIAGDALLQVKEDGVLNIETDNSDFSGVVMVNGVLNAAGANALGSGDVYVMDAQAELNVTAADALGSSGDISVLGGAVLNINASNASYKGNVFVMGGSLTVTAENGLGDGSGEIFVSDGSFDSGAVTVMNHVIMHGASRINAVAARNVTFNTGAVISGSYTLDDGNALTIASGNVDFTGDFVFNGGTVILQDNSSKFDITGTTTLGGVTWYAADGPGGAVSHIDVSGWNITPGVSYTLMGFNYDPTIDPNDYFDVLFGAKNAWMKDRYTLTYENGALMLTVEQPLGNDPVVEASLSRNRAAAYRAMSAIAASGASTGTLNKYANRVAGTLDPAAVDKMLAMLSGEELVTAMNSQIEGNVSHLRRLRGYIGTGTVFAPREGMSAYITGFNEDYKVKADASGPGFSRVEWGGSAGFEKRLSTGALVGVGVSQSRARLMPDGTEKTGMRQHEDATRVDLYLAADLGGGVKSVTSVGVGMHRFDFHRILPDGERSDAKMSGSSLNFMEEVSFTLCESNGDSLSAYASLMSSVNRIGSFIETGADTASLAGDKRTAWATDISLGLRYASSFALVSGAPAAVAGIQTGLVFSVGDTTADLDLHFVGAPVSRYRISSARRNRVGYSLGGDLTVPVSGNMAVFGSAGAVLRGDSTEVNASVGLRVNF